MSCKYIKEAINRKLSTYEQNFIKYTNDQANQRITDAVCTMARDHTTDNHKSTVMITENDTDHKESKQTLHIVSQITEGHYRLMFAMYRKSTTSSRKKSLIQYQFPTVLWKIWVLGQEKTQ